MQKKITCPVCENPINYYDGECLKYYDYDDCILKESLIKCPHCNQQVIWIERYYFDVIQSVFTP